MPVRRGTSRVRPTLVALGLATAVFAGVAVTGSSLIGAQRADAAVSAPEVTCTTPEQTFDTGYDPDTGTVIANGSTDLHWQAASAGNLNGVIKYPTSTTTWSDAIVGNSAPSSWVTSPYADANWIHYEPNGVTSVTADWYYRLQFSLDSDVDPSNLSLALNFLADNNVAEIWVNDVPQSGLTPGIPQSTSNPYFSSGFTAGAEAATVLNHDWQTGANEVVVQIQSGAPYEGFDADARYQTVLCPTPGVSASDATATPGVYSAGQHITYTVTVTNTGNDALNDIAVENRDFSGAGAEPQWTCPSTISIGSSATCTGTYTVVPGDLVAAKIGNTPVVTAVGQAIDVTSTADALSTTVSPIDVTIDGGATATTTVVAPTITGTSNVSAGSTITVSVDGQSLSTTLAANGTWSVTPAPLAFGTYTVDVTADGINGATATATQSLVVSPIDVTIDGGTTTTTTDATPKVSGTTNASAGSTVTVTVGGQTLTTTVGADGTWSVIPAALVPDTYAVDVEIVDAGGASANATQSLVITAAAAPGLPASDDPGTGTLAFTGSDVAPVAGVSLLLLIAGGVVLLVRRRRRRSASVNQAPTHRS
jgi:hypothetical protein